MFAIKQISSLSFFLLVSKLYFSAILLISSFDLNLFRGNIILYNTNEVLGTHNGIYNYTIGQRKGLNISYKEPLYVISLDKKNNNVIIGTNDDLYKDKLTASNVNYLVEKDEFKLPLYAKIRSRGNLEEIDNIKEEDNNIIVTFKNKIRAITPGQYIVFYNENKVCLGGATIEK